MSPLFLKVIVSIIVSELVGILSAPITINAIPGWYAQLTKPPFNPPNWIFGPVWTFLYMLMGISFGIIWNMKSSKKTKKAKIYFLFQLFLNFLWSIGFFGLHSPIMGLAIIIPLWILILLCILRFYPLSKIASYLFIPYLMWVSFAAILNFSLFILN